MYVKGTEGWQFSTLVELNMQIKLHLCLGLQKLRGELSTEDANTASNHRTFPLTCRRYLKRSTLPNPVCSSLCLFREVSFENYRFPSFRSLNLRTSIMLIFSNNKPLPLIAVAPLLSDLI